MVEGRRTRKVTSIEANASKASFLLRAGRRKEAERLLEKIAEDDELWLWAVLAGLEEE